MKVTSLLLLLLNLCFSSHAAADLFLVSTTEGPGFAEPNEVIQVLEKGIIPTFNHLIELKGKKKIVAAGLPVGSRTFYLIVEADTHDEVDRMLRDIPAWGIFSWSVTPLQSLEGRAAIEREILKSLKSKN